jgi:hypothetical protein
MSVRQDGGYLFISVIYMHGLLLRKGGVHPDYELWNEEGCVGWKTQLLQAVKVGDIC